MDEVVSTCFQPKICMLPWVQLLDKTLPYSTIQYRLRFEFTYAEDAPHSIGRDTIPKINTSVWSGEHLSCSCGLSTVKFALVSFTQQYKQPAAFHLARVVGRT